MEMENSQMYILIGIVFIIVGLIMLISPKTFYDIIEGWKSVSCGEPTSLFIISTRVGGTIFFVLGIASIILL